MALLWKTRRRTRPITLLTADQATMALAQELHFKVAESLEVLGVQAYFDKPWQLLRFHARKAILRMRLLGWTARHNRVQKAVLSSLAVPCFAWAAGFARSFPEDLKAIRNEVIQVFASFSQGPARAPLFEAVGWATEPTFSCDLGALRVLWKACAVCPTWLDTVPLPDAVFRWKELIPEAPRVIEKFGWSFRADGSVLQRTDRQNTIHSLRPGFDGFPCVIEWMRQHYRQQTALGSARVSRGPGPASASGGGDYYFEGHRRALALETRSANLSSLATALEAFNKSRRRALAGRQLPREATCAACLGSWRSL